MEDKPINNWPTVKEKLKDEFPHLTEDDLIYEMGKEEELLTRLEEKLNKNKEDLKGWLSLMG